MLTFPILHQVNLLCERTSLGSTTFLLATRTHEKALLPAENITLRLVYAHLLASILYSSRACPPLTAGMSITNGGILRVLCAKECECCGRDLLCFSRELAPIYLA